MSARWVISRQGQEDEILECDADGSGCLTRTAGQVVRGRWKEDGTALRFNAPSGEYYQGRFDDETRQTLSKGLISRGVGKIIGRFTACRSSLEMLLPDLVDLPPSPSPLPRLPSSVRYVPNFISAEDEAKLLENVRNAPANRWSVGHAGCNQLRKPWADT